jgi:hypothetical protein
VCANLNLGMSSNSTATGCAALGKLGSGPAVLRAIGYGNPAQITLHGNEHLH